jgi:hypothetical protein
MSSIARRGRVTLNVDSARVLLIFFWDNTLAKSLLGLVGQRMVWSDLQTLASTTSPGALLIHTQPLCYIQCLVCDTNLRAVLHYRSTE